MLRVGGIGLRAGAGRNGEQAENNENANHGSAKAPYRNVGDYRPGMRVLSITPLRLFGPKYYLTLAITANTTRFSYPGSQST
jgi:hypothetical protein